MVGGNKGEWEATLDGRKYLAVRGSPGGAGQEEIVKEFWGYIQGEMDY
jgi:myo-inositol-1(or 4)-monophosphatase